MKKLIIGVDVVLIILPFLISFLKVINIDNELVKSVVDDASFSEIFIIPLLSLIVVEILSFKYDYNCFKEVLDGYATNISNDIDNYSLNISNDIDNVVISIEGIRLSNEFSFNEIKHPYFKDILIRKFEDFMYENNSLLNNKYITNPNSRDTYGISGIKNTKKSLFCVSAISDYWDTQNEQYIEVQRMLIKGGVIIQRLFVVNEKNYSKALEEMKRQTQYGVDVRYIDEKIMINSSGFRDYLIQDGMLLVDLVVPKGNSKEDYIKDSKINHLEVHEIITYGCYKRLKEFRSHWNRATTLENIITN